MPTKQPPKILALIVTHNGADTICEVLDSLDSVGKNVALRTMLIDNSSGDNTLDLAIGHALADMEIVPLGVNLGVAAAYNMGLQRARERDVSWMFILDQDSVCAPECLDLLWQTARELQRSGNDRVGAVCPTPRSKTHPEQIHYPYAWRSGRFYPVTDSLAGSHGALSIDSTITSGTLYKVEALNSVGGFRETYFIDFVDHECHLRLRRQGWSMWWVREAFLDHCLGCRQQMTGGGLWIEHKPYRYYYMARNMTEGYYRLGGMKSVIFFWADLWRHARMLQKNSVRSRECVHYLIKGVAHALWGKSGPLAPQA